MQNEVFVYVTPLLYHLKSCAKHQRSISEQSRWASSSHIINKGVRNHRWLIIKYVYDKWSEENTDKIGWWKELTTSGWVVSQGLSVKGLLSWNLNDKKPDIWISREGAFQAGRASNTNALIEEFPGTEKHVNTTENEEEHRDKAHEIGRWSVLQAVVSGLKSIQKLYWKDWLDLNYVFFKQHFALYVENGPNVRKEQRR